MAVKKNVKNTVSDYHWVWLKGYRLKDDKRT